jgi:uncharacterized protein (TIGR03435 family)
MSRPWAIELLKTSARCALLLIASATIRLYSTSQVAQPGDDPRFEVASVKAAEHPGEQAQFDIMPKRQEAPNLSLRFLIQQAYGLPGFQLTGAQPALARLYDVSAVTAEPASSSEMRPMLRGPLRDRFHLAVHWETRSEALYQLVVAPEGHHMTVAPQGYRRNRP